MGERRQDSPFIYTCGGYLSAQEALSHPSPDIYTFPLSHTQLALSERPIWVSHSPSEKSATRLVSRSFLKHNFLPCLASDPLRAAILILNSLSSRTESEYTFTTFCALLAIIFPTPASTLKPPPRPCQTLRLTYSQIKHQAQDDLTACTIQPRFGKDSIDDRDDTHTNPNFLAVPFILKTVQGILRNLYLFSYDRNDEKPRFSLIANGERYLQAQGFPPNLIEDH